MSCHHRYGHGCDWPAPPPDRYDAYAQRPRRYRDEVVVIGDDELEPEEEPRPRRRRRRREDVTARAEVTPESLLARADELRAELQGVEKDLKRLR